MKCSVCDTPIVLESGETAVHVVDEGQNKWYHAFCWESFVTEDETKWMLICNSPFYVCTALIDRGGHDAGYAFD